MKKIIKEFQHDLIKIYKSGKNKPLYLLAEDNCSEASRLIAIWIKRKFSKAKLSILKGEYLPKKFHDVLVIKLNNKFYLIDASIWQFFKNKRNIFVGEFNNIPDLILQAQKIYGGKWDGLKPFKNFQQENELIEIIQANL